MFTVSKSMCMFSKSYRGCNRAAHSQRMLFVSSRDFISDVIIYYDYILVI